MEPAARAVAARAEVDREFDRVERLAAGDATLDARLARPFHQGIVHSKTDTELAVLPHFRPLYADAATVAAARATVAAWFADDPRAPEKRPPPAVLTPDPKRPRRA